MSEHRKDHEPKSRTHPAGDIVRTVYSNDATIKDYLTVGLWPAEEILVDTYFEREGPVLDIGCGAGRTSIALAEKGFRVSAIDLVPAMIDAARKQAREHATSPEWAVMDASVLSFDDETFQQALFSYNGYEHVPDDGTHQRVLTEAWRVLKPGGIFILTSRSGIAFGRRWVAWGWMLVRHYLLRPLGLGAPGLGLGEIVNKGSYYRYRSPFRIRRLLEEAGFKFEFFNSRKNIERRVESSFFTNFSSDTCLFFVARKPYET